MGEERNIPPPLLMAAMGLISVDEMLEWKSNERNQ